MTAKTLYEKIWNNHVVYEEPGNLRFSHRSPPDSRRYLTAGIFRPSRRGPQSAFVRTDVRRHGPFQSPQKTARFPIIDQDAKAQFDALEKNCKESGVRTVRHEQQESGDRSHIGPELGITQPGQTIVCGDSHTSTHGAFGTLAFGIGTSEVEHVLATQCLVQGNRRRCTSSFTASGPRA